MLIAPKISVHVDHNDTRHWWSCDACGHEFMTAVTMANIRAAQYRVA
jgi:hypothetical protein